MKCANNFEKLGCSTWNIWGILLVDFAHKSFSYFQTLITRINNSMVTNIKNQIHYEKNVQCDNVQCTK